MLAPLPSCCHHKHAHRTLSHIKVAAHFAFRGSTSGLFHAAEDAEFSGVTSGPEKAPPVPHAFLGRHLRRVRRRPGRPVSLSHTHTQTRSAGLEVMKANTHSLYFESITHLQAICCHSSDLMGHLCVCVCGGIRAYVSCRHPCDSARSGSRVCVSFLGNALFS